MEPYRLKDRYHFLLALWLMSAVLYSEHKLYGQSAAQTQTMKVGIGQMHVDGGNPELNLANAVRFIEEASKEACDIVVLPECLDFGWTHSSALSGAQPIPGPYSEVLQNAAKDQGIYVIAGLTERDGEEIFNTAIMISPAGEILAKHRKINILDIARHIYSPGNSCSVTPTELGKIGMNICADNSPATNQLGHSLGFMGADIILSPCSWAVPPDFDNEKTPYGDIWKQSYTEIAQKHHIPVIGVSNTGLVKDGAWQGWWCIGASLVVSKDGQIQKQFAYTREGSELYVIEVEM
jgi:predicted amidohydrolase